MSRAARLAILALAALEQHLLDQQPDDTDTLLHDVAILRAAQESIAHIRSPQ